MSTDKQPVTVQIPEPFFDFNMEMMCSATCPLIRSVDWHKWCTGGFSESKPLEGPLRPGPGCPWYEKQGD